MDGRLYVVSTLVDGPDLTAFLDLRRRLDPAPAAHLLAPAASALDLVHRRGLVHRDVRPANLLVVDDGRS